MRAIGITGHQKAPSLVWKMLAERLPDIVGPVPFVGVSSLAAGADQVFASEVLRLGGRLCAVIPSREYETTFTTPLARRQYESLVNRSIHVECLEFNQPNEDAYMAAGHRVVDLSDKIVAVWDGLPAKGKGGTADIVEYASRCQKSVVRIWPEGTQR